MQMRLIHPHQQSWEWGNETTRMDRKQIKQHTWLSWSRWRYWWHRKSTLATAWTVANTSKGRKDSKPTGKEPRTSYVVFSDLNWVQPWPRVQEAPQWHGEVHLKVQVTVQGLEGYELSYQRPAWTQRGQTWSVPVANWDLTQGMNDI